MSLLAALKPKPGDFTGFVQLFFDNTATLLVLIGALLGNLIGSGDDSPQGDAIFKYQGIVQDLIYGTILPGLGITMIFGNIYYAIMGARLAVKEDREDVTCLPYGINTPGAFAFIFGILIPVFVNEFYNVNVCVAIPDKSSDAFVTCMEKCLLASWRVGVTSNFLAGIICVILGFVGNQIRQITPAVALLTSLAGIGFAFLGLAQVAANFAHPLVGLLPLFITIVGYMGNVTFGKIPISVVVIITGMILGWADGIVTAEEADQASLLVKSWGIGTGFEALGDWTGVDTYLGTTFTVALAAAAGTLMNVYSAEQAGDKYGVVETMVSDGIGTMVAALFGCPFGTSVYIGHPAYKKMGAGCAYSLINCVLFFFFSIFGIFGFIAKVVPPQAINPLLFFVGLMIVEEAIAAAHVRHYPAVAFGLFPAISDWAINNGVSFGRVGSENYYGLVALGKSSLLVCLCLMSISIYAIDRNFLPASIWAVATALLALFGFIHQDAARAKDWTQPLGYFVYCDLAGPAVDGSVTSFYNETLDTCSPPIGKPQLKPSYLQYCFTPAEPFEGKGCGYARTLSWRFMVGYLMVAVFLVACWLAQKRGWVLEQIEEEEDEEEVKKSTVVTILKQRDSLREEEIEARKIAGEA